VRPEYRVTVPATSPVDPVVDPVVATVVVAPEAAQEARIGIVRRAAKARFACFILPPYLHYARSANHLTVSVREP
jgi:hypothetical protein